eukprot:PhM_4_TR6104/c0_g1_i1/m.8407
MPYRRLSNYRFIVGNKLRQNYHMPHKPHQLGNPFVNKMPHEYANNERAFLKVGLWWYDKIRHRGVNAGNPERMEQRDPYGHNMPVDTSKCFSARAKDSGVLGEPRWDYYTHSHQRFRVSPKLPVSLLVPYLHTYVGKVWSRTESRAFLDAIHDAGFTSIESAAAGLLDAVPGSVPTNFARHVSLLSNAIVQQDVARRNREHRHQTRSDLRTVEGERYYALPYARGPTFPVKLAQPAATAPRYNVAELINHDIHPIFSLEHERKRNLMP